MANIKFSQFTNDTNPNSSSFFVGYNSVSNLNVRVSKANLLTSLGAITGTGTTNYLPKFTGASALGNSIFSDNGSIGYVSGNLQVENTTSTITLASTFAGAFQGIEFRQLGSLDATIQQNPATGEFRISNGRSVGWGGIQTFYTDTVERMRITDLGNILINTTTNAGYKLDVNGTARVSGVLGATAGLNNTGVASDTWAASSSEGLAIKGSATNSAVQTITSYLDNTSIRIGAGVSQKTGILINGQTSGSGSSVLISTGGATRLTIAATGAATFSSSVTATQGTFKANNVFNQDGDGQISIRGASVPEKTLLIGFDTTSNYGYLQSIWQGNSSKPLVLQPWAANVLIGTTTDAGYKLDVNGTARVVGAATFSSSVTVSSGGSTNGRLGVRGTTNDSSAYAFEAANSSGSTLFIVRNDGVASIDGKLLIGTFTPGGSPLKAVGLPTSSAGLSAGDIWNDGGTLKIV